ncbi:MAG: hypothetical protein HY235_23105 [Acidobacteria bacterium]|nr:hypothetical protein [Acidobacteriota bacterium]
MATYPQALSALTTSQFLPKWGSLGSDAIAFSAPENVRVTPPAWLKPTIQSFLGLLQLPHNWDGYGAVRIQEQIVQQALMALVQVMDDDTPAPSVVPLSDGGVQVE